MLREPPPCPDLLYIAPDGSIECRSENLDTLLAFYEWRLHRACEHENGELLHHRIGNIWEVALLRQELTREPENFPIILGKVIYSGSHGGDHLSVAEVRQLQGELHHLERFVCLDEVIQKYVEWFRQQLQELTEAALRVGKPISF